MKNRNYFSKKMENKSDEYLRNVLTNSSFVEDAKLAASFELKERGIAVNYEVKEKEKESNQGNLNSGKSSKFNGREEYAFSLFIFACICIFYSLSLLPDFFVRNDNDSLKEIKGTVKNSTVIIEEVSARGRFGYEAKSQRASLIFSFNEHKKQFKLVENIGDDIKHEEFQEVSKLLNDSNDASVWVKKNDDSVNPKIFQIDADDSIILDLQSIKFQHFFVFMMLITLGTLSLIFLWLNGGRELIDDFRKKKIL